MKENQKVYPPAKLPLFVKILYLLAGGSIPLYIVLRLSVRFADFFNRTISQFLRRVLATATAWIPFSFAEILLLALPVAFALLLIYAIRHNTDSWHNVGVFVLKILSVVCVLLILFVWNFSAGYYVPTLDSKDKLNLERQDVSAEDLYDTTLVLIDKIREVTPEVAFLPEDFSVMPYSREEMNRKLTEAYDAFSADHAFLSTFDCRVKPVMLSEWMSYTHITGVYTFFTGEANVNVAFPDYTIPFTAAHELAHQRGIAREDEANFIAFLVCIGSDDPYLRYSGYQNMYEYVSGALYRADPERYKEALSRLPAEVRYEMIAYNKFYEKYENSAVGTVSGAINDTYLKSQGTEGTKSYGLVVDLCVAYYK